MTSYRVPTAMYQSVGAQTVTVEASFARGYPSIQLLGNATEICRDGRERARTALESLGIQFPGKKIILNMSPADIRKDGSQCDLAFAVSMALLLTASPSTFEIGNWIFAAELALDGNLQPCRGVVSCALAAASAGFNGIVVAHGNVAELHRVTALAEQTFENFQVVAFSNLKEVLDWVLNGIEPTPIIEQSPIFPEKNPTKQPNFDDMLLNEDQKRMVLASATGMHSVLLRGAPGTGKSMLASRLTSILPTMQAKEHIEALQIVSMSDQPLTNQLLRGRPPFRNPHHAASMQAILGRPDQPGELSLAHGGILFLDEFTEFRRDLTEALREPLETGKVQVSRSKSKIEWCSRVLLIAACNNCPCGWFGSHRRVCNCSAQKRIAYEQRLSGPILDRIDIHFDTPEDHLDHGDLLTALSQQSSKMEPVSADLTDLVAEGRERAAHRNQSFGVVYNRDIPPKSLQAASGLGSGEFSRLLEGRLSKSSSTRSVIRCLRVTRTLADIDGADAITPKHLETATQWQAESSAARRGQQKIIYAHLESGLK